MKRTYLPVCFSLLPDILLQKPDVLKQNPSMNTPELKDKLENKGKNICFQVNVTRIVNSLNLMYRVFSPEVLSPAPREGYITITIYKTILCIYIVCADSIQSTIY